MGLLTDKYKEIKEPDWLDIMRAPVLYSWSGWRGFIGQTDKDRVVDITRGVISECFPENVSEIMAEAKDLLRILERPEYEDDPPSDIFNISWGYGEMKFKDVVLGNINGNIIDRMSIDIIEKWDLDEILVEAVKWTLAGNNINIFIDIEWSYSDRDESTIAAAHYHNFDIATIHTEIELWD